MAVCFCSSGDTAKIAITTVEAGTQEIISKKPPLCITTYGAGNILTYGSAWIRPENHPANFDYVPNAVSWDGNCATRLGGQTCQAFLDGANTQTTIFNGVGTCQITITPTEGGATITDAQGMMINIQSAHPITFEGSCNGNCPAGYCKIDCPEYPGYCCLSCDEINSLFLQLNNK